MKTLRFCLTLVLLLLPVVAIAQQDNSNKPPAASAAAQTEDISGMYTFLREGEFVQVTVEDGNQVSGFVSRYGEAGTDKGTFLDQFFSKASLNDKHLTFTTKPIHGVWFEFDGTVERGPGKTPHDEGYRVLKGTLRQISEESNQKQSAKLRQVTLKSFPQDLDEDQQKKP